MTTENDIKRLDKKVQLSSYMQRKSKDSLREDLQTRMDILEVWMQKIASQLDLEISQQQIHRQHAKILSDRIEKAFKDWI